MHPLNLNGKEAVVIDVEMDAKDFRIKGDELYWKSSIWGLAAIGHLKKLPSPDYILLGTLNNGVPDFDVREYVEENSEWVLSVKHILGYRGYCGERKIRNGYFSSYPLDTPQESFLSLLHSQNITTEGKKVVLVNQSK